MINEVKRNVGATSSAAISRGSIYQHKVQEQEQDHLETRAVWKKRKAGAEVDKIGRLKEDEDEEEDCESGVSSDWEDGLMLSSKRKKKKKNLEEIVEEDLSTVTSLVQQCQARGSCSSSSRRLDEEGDEMMVIVEDEEEDEVDSPTYVLSSGRTTRQVQKQLTIDDEFEEYFRQLML